MLPLLLAAIVAMPANVVRVADVASLRKAIAAATPGTLIEVAPGEYAGGMQFSNVHGSAAKPIVITAADVNNLPKFKGGGSTLQFSDVSYLEISNLQVSGATGNGVNIDDGGSIETPSHHVTLKNLRVSDLPKGNNDGIKLSGLDDFKVMNCTVERWAGSGIDMVGCHRGVIEGCTFRNGGDSGVQAKGGTSAITITGCRFEDFGQRGVNIGGSTGMPYFRPTLAQMPATAKYEAKEIVVEYSTFVNGIAPVAFVGVDGAKVRFNTIVNPGKWAIRILQETQAPGFVPSRNGAFTDNLIVFKSTSWGEGGVNIGSGTAPETFSFARNFWFCSDRPDRSAPRLPTPEKSPIIGRDPLFVDPSEGNYSVKKGSPAERAGAHVRRAG